MSLGGPWSDALQQGSFKQMSLGNCSQETFLGAAGGITTVL